MAHKINVSVASLQPSQFEGWATKQGGGWKSWKRRWFVIKDRKMWYFVGKTDTEAKGWIDLTPGTEVRDMTEPGQKKKFAFCIKSRGAKGEREFPIFVESETDLKGFLKAINQVLQGDKKPTQAPKPNNFAPPNVNASSAPPANEPVAPPPMTTAFVPQMSSDDVPPVPEPTVPVPPEPTVQPFVSQIPPPQPEPTIPPAQPTGFGGFGGFGSAPPAQPPQPEPVAAPPAQPSGFGGFGGFGSAPAQPPQPTPVAVPPAQPEPTPVVAPPAQPEPTTQPTGFGGARPGGFGGGFGGFGGNRFGARPQQQTTTPVAAPPPSLNIPANIARQPVPNMLQMAIDMCNWVKSNNPEGVLDFLGIWKDSLPVNTDMEPGEIANVKLIVSANTHKLSWRVDGPQGALIQKMVDFFWNVGAPEGEIDRLNDLGAEINPMNIGSWIDMSEEGGMDGGWYFPVDTDLNIGKNAGDLQGPANCIGKMVEWATKNGLNMISSLGRDMGATPPRQTDFKYKVVGPSSAKLNVVKDAIAMFGFPAIPSNVENAINSYTGNEITLSIITTTEGFARLSIIIPEPNAQILSQVVESVTGHDIQKHQQYLNTFGQPVAVEYSFLNQGFGFEVYREGADAHVHYLLGTVTI